MMVLIAACSLVGADGLQPTKLRRWKCTLGALAETTSLEDATSTVVTSVTSDMPRESLTVLERLGRAAKFYSAAIPIFASYKLLDIKQKLFPSQSIDPQTEWDQLHDWGSDEISKIITELKGFYPKTGQIIATRVDIFPEQYTSKFANFLDDLDPLDPREIVDVIRRDLLDGAELSEMFSEFDEIPLGSASIAQVHKARLLDGRVVAVKVQRPGVRGKLLGDIANLKNFAKIVKDALPLDYYKVFCEIEKNLGQELDFLIEAQYTMKVASAVSHSPNNRPLKKPPVLVPLPIPGLVSQRVMVLEFVDGVALSKLAKEMAERGIKPGSVESKIFGQKLLTALTDAYSNMIFGSGIIHGDPHPGNIFILENGDVALLDCGQVKMLKSKERIKLAELVVLVNQWEAANKANPNSAESKRLIALLADNVRKSGVSFAPDVGDDCAAAVAILLFGNTGTKLPGGFAGEELSRDSPIAKVIEFPQEQVLLGRATVMIKGIANRLGLSWSLSDRWAAAAQEAIDAVGPKERLPIWSVAEPTIYSKFGGLRRFSSNSRIRFTEVLSSLTNFLGTFSSYMQKKTMIVAQKLIPDWLSLKLTR